jgi:predicted ferric reductase
MLNIASVKQFKETHPAVWGGVKFLGIILVFITGFAGTLILAAASQTPLGKLAGSLLNWLFAANSTQVMWYFTRSAGMVSYLLLWFSMIWGLLIPTKLFDQLIPRANTFDFHQFISLLSVGFIILHVGVLLLDQYLPFNLAQILFPFIAPYRPVWVGIGVLAFYLTLLVTITFYMRSRIGMKAFKSIHLFSLLAYAGATLHGLMAGTDSTLPAVRWMYFLSFLVVVFLTSYYLLAQQEKKAVVLPTTRQPVRQP